MRCRYKPSHPHQREYIATREPKNEPGALMAQCECGCGQGAEREFLPGHNQKLRTQLESRAGGVLALRDLIDATQGYLSGQSQQALANIEPFLPS